MSAEKRARELLAELNSNAIAYELLGETELPRLLREAAAALTPQWQPISTAPRDGTAIDLWHPLLGRIAESRWDTYLERWTIICDPKVPTHWMPIPAPPEGE